MSPGPVGHKPEPVPDAATQHMIRMRDGVRLATDVYLPATHPNGPIPAVLTRLPYDKNSRYVFMESIADRVNRRGYGFVAQDVRGKFRSEGDPIGPLSEVRDGYDTVDWVSRQEWCNGDVAMFGDSYYGFTQWAALSSQHPALKALVPRVTSAELPSMHSLDAGGIHEAPWLTLVLYVAQCWADSYIREDVEPNWNLTPLTAVFDDIFDRIGSRSTWYDLEIPHQLKVPIYGDGHPFDARPVPTLHSVAWFDNMVRFHINDYLKLASNPATAPFQYLLAESTDHENYFLADAPIQQENDHGENDQALERMLDEYIGPALEFFDVFVKGQGSPTSIPRVRWNLGYVGRQVSETWPPVDTTVEFLYLTQLDKASNGPAHLSASPPAVLQVCEWRYDPDNLVASTVTNSFAFIYEYPDEQVSLQHADVIAFESEPVDSPLDLAGPINLQIRVTSDAPTTDVFAKLCDRGPDGSARMIVRGQGVLANPSADDLVTINLGHTGYRLQSGHRLHLQIASSDYPEFAPNSGSHANRWTVPTRAPSNQTLRTDQALPSRLSLTVLREAD